MDVDGDCLLSVRITQVRGYYGQWVGQILIRFVWSGASVLTRFSATISTCVEEDRYTSSPLSQLRDARQ